MKDKLRELAGDWRVSADAHAEIGFGAAADVGHRCAAELLSILDADSDMRRDANRWQVFRRYMSSANPAFMDTFAETLPVRPTESQFDAACDASLAAAMEAK